MPTLPQPSPAAEAVAPPKAPGTDTGAVPGFDVDPGSGPGIDLGPDSGVRPAPRPRLYVLDGLRLIASLGVVAFHWTGVDIHRNIWDGTPRELMPTIHRFGAYGWMGVQLFFLISGFVICMSGWGKSPRAYFNSRVVRLFPAYWIGILLTTAVVNYWPTARTDRKPMSVSEVLTNFTMLERPLGATEADGVYWTLWIELRFYILFAIMVAIGLTYRRVLAFCLVWSTLSVIAANVDNKLLGYMVQPEDAPYFIAGIVLYLIYRFGANPMLLGIVVFEWLIAQNRLHVTVGGYEYEVHHSLSWPVMAVLSGAAFLVMLAVAMGAFNRVQWKWLTVAGALTYPVYLLHQEIGWAMIRLARHQGIGHKTSLVLCLLFILALAWVVHRYGERPLSRLLQRLMDARSLSIPKADPPVKARVPAAGIEGAPAD
ncbi:acyltransferase family protein [Kitasatospora phosalacinea]|uniref:acyltransferase family protein n=1 Tax=Kitasatospora phosalacinea TaxID=2065 RepID=UPI0006913A99|nr:acyltransferase [Kitasatospora phosalacinea]